MLVGSIAFMKNNPEDFSIGGYHTDAEHDPCASWRMAIYANNPNDVSDIIANNPQDWTYSFRNINPHPLGCPLAK